MKPKHRSKTLWFSFALVVFGALMDNFSYIQNFIDPKYYGLIFAGVGIVVAILRYVTKQPINP